MKSSISTNMTAQYKLLCHKEIFLFKKIFKYFLYLKKLFVISMRFCNDSIAVHSLFFLKMFEKCEVKLKCHFPL